MPHFRDSHPSPELFYENDSDRSLEQSRRLQEEGRWMERFYDGDEDAFEKLYVLFFPLLMRQALKQLPSYLPARRELAEDMVSEVFAKAAATFDRVETRWDPSRGGMGVWLRGILRKQIISFLRTKKGKEQTSTDASAADAEGRPQPMENQMPAPPSESVCRLAVEQRRHDVQLAMIQLSPEERQVLQLRFWRQQRYREISRLTGMSIPTVSRRLHAAQQKMGGILEEGELTFDDLPPDLSA